MDIRKLIKSLNRNELLIIKNYIDFQLSDTSQSGFGDMAIKDFEQKIKELGASSRLIIAINEVSYKVEFVYQITRVQLMRQRNVGQKTWNEFKQIRRY
jgi:DNA-directed RNA polymerase alpha subunit